MTTATELLAHPLFLLVAGALLTGLLLPYVTRQWETRRKELEIKTDLVTDICEATMGLVAATQVVHYGSVGGRGMSQEDFNDSYETWMVRRAVIGARLQAYFSTSADSTPSIPDEWERFSHVVERFYALEGVPDEDARRDQREWIRDSLRSLLSHGGEGQTRTAEPRTEEWESLRAGIDLALDDLSRRVLESDVRLGS